MRKYIYTLAAVMALTPLAASAQDMQTAPKPMPGMEKPMPKKPMPGMEKPMPMDGAMAMDQKDIVDTAISTGMFTKLVAAVEAAGLVEMLKGPGPYTVFAPTDAAFAKLKPGTVENLLKPENKQMLVKILSYHVVSGNVPAAEVMKMKTAKTVEGEDVKIKSSKGTVMINKAKVIKADVVATNGTIHVIDTVLMPK